MKSVFGQNNLAARVVAVATCGLLLQTTCGASFQQASTPVDVRRLNNLGVAYMNQQLPAKALEYFRRAIAADNTLAVPHVNAGIALLNVQKTDEAREQMEQAAKLDGRNPRVWYNLGLVARALGDAESAQQDFAHVLEIDPESADAHYLMGATLLERNDYSHAIPEFRRSLAISPLHASAEFGLARALQRSGDTVAAREHLARFQHITEEKLASPMGQSYGDQGSYSLAQEIRPTPAIAEPMIPISFRPKSLSAGNVQSDPDGNNQALAGGLCALDLGGQKKADLIVLNDGENRVSFYLSLKEGGFQRQSGVGRGVRIEGRPIACAVGDIDNDGKPDIALTTEQHIYLFRQLANGQFEDITRKAGLQSKNRPAGITFIDFDHDGDLDLFATGVPTDQPNSHPNVLWRNNGNLTFTDWTEETGLGGEGNTTAAVLSDINNDRAVDLVTSGVDGAMVYLNEREGRFRRVPLYLKESLPPATGLAILDFDKDGWMDVVLTHEGAPGVTLWRNVEGKRFERVSLSLKQIDQASGVAPFDFDNDGWIDLVFLAGNSSASQLRLLRNAGNGHFEDVTTKVGIASARLHAGPLLAIDANGDGSPDIVAHSASSGPVLLENVGGNRNHSLSIRLRGLADNKMAIGTKVEVFAGGSWQKFEVTGANGLFSQSSEGILVGFGSSSRPDIIRLLWPTGVPQDEIEPSATGVLNIEEIDRRGSSCPVLFSWNGKEYEFVTDVIGAAVIGHWISPHARNTPDPDEWIKISGSQLKAEKGFFSLRFGEPMEEVNYLDNVKLVAVDHPSDTDVYPNERFLSDPPFAKQQTIVTASAHSIASAWDDKGHDVTHLLRLQDRHYVEGFDRLAFAGFASDHGLTLDIGSWSPQRPLRLLMSGYIEYFTANSMYAAWQGGVPAKSPYIEARLADGTWKRVVDDMGFPAGLRRTIVVDLTGKLPLGTKEIRIITNLQIYWDRVLVSNDDDAQFHIRETEIPLNSASLAFRGYPKQIEGRSPGDLTYSYKEASNTGPFIRQSGMHTRYGNVTPLLQNIDDEYVIFGSGEDIDIEFDGSGLPSLPQGWKRDYFFYANGYVKDMDYYEAMPYTVSSMPFHRMSAYPYTAPEHFPDDKKSTDYQLRWNTRVESAKPPTSYQFRYERRASAPDLIP